MTSQETTTKEFAGGKLRLHTEGEIATLELNQPQRRNALSCAMWEALPAVVETVEADATIRAVVVRGNGATFSAGADISEFSDVYGDAGSARAYNGAVRKAQSALRHIKRPTVAVIEGACIGGGCGLALACDLRFAASSARFAITPARLGLAYSFADTTQLVEKIGPARAKDMLFSGREFDAAEALSIGLIDRLLPEAELQQAVNAYVHQLAAVSQTSILAAKAMINAMTEPVANAEMNALFDASFDGPDFLEGYRAFLEKRVPDFRRSKD